jgi:hypothetical protein
MGGGGGLSMSKKVLISGPTPFNDLCNGYCPSQNHYVLRHTAKTKYRNFETNIPRKGISGLSPNFHIHASVSDLYIPTIGLPILQEEICRPILGGLYKSLTDT